ncbi:MAG: hypothetical protein ACT4TC_17555, partial [Myxococcaceae bacterium]
MTPLSKLCFALALFFTGPVVAATDLACWNRDIERMDHLENPPEHGDNGFFTGVSNQSDSTNVVLLYPASSSMRELTQKLYRIRVDLGGITPTGCTNAYLDSLSYFMPNTVAPPAGSAALQGIYSSAKNYPDPGPSYSGGGGQADGLTNNKAYRYLQWGANGGAIAETENAACDNATASVTERSNCRA